MSACSCQEHLEYRYILHYHITWHIQDIYMGFLIFQTGGPNFTVKVPSFPWMLSLGQSKRSEFKGISLYIHCIEMPVHLVNFRVSVLEQNSKLLLDKTFWEIFGSGQVWESPVLVTNYEIEWGSTLFDISDFWEVSVQLIWKELIFRAIPSKSIIISVARNYSELYRQRKVGLDLERFFKSSMFSDICVTSGNINIPAHKVILAAGSPYLAEKIDSYVGGNSKIDDCLIPSIDPHAADISIMYLYTGDGGCLVDHCRLRIGIHECAKQMKMRNLEYLTQPYVFHGRTAIKVNTVSCMVSVEKVDCLREYIKSLGNPHQALFYLSVLVDPQENASTRFSVILKFISIGKGESIYAVVNFSLKGDDDDDDKFSRTAVKILKSGSAVKYEFLHNVKLLQLKGRTPGALRFFCKIRYSTEEMDTVVGRIPSECFVNDAELQQPPNSFIESQSGWENLTTHLYKILESEKFCDCTMVIGSDRLPAHRVILAARSPYFSDLFRRKEEHCPGSSMGMEVSFDPDKYKTTWMKIILKAIYTGCAEYTMEMANDIFRLVRIFELDFLEKECLGTFPAIHMLHLKLKSMELL